MAVCARHDFRFFAADAGSFKFLHRFLLAAPLENIPPSECEELTIRPFAQGDLLLVHDFFERMGGESRSYFNRADGNRKDALSFFVRENQNVRRWLATAREGERDVMAGYVFLWNVSTGVPGFGIALGDEYKGRGLGKVLVAHARKYAETAGCGGIE
jgi:GNAT superfamily N-acetyltransferase